jgi:uncharacterized membrane protein YhfC
MLTVAYLLSISGIIILPILLAFYLTQKFKLSWKLVLAGALTFIASQVLHIPVVYSLTALFNNGTLPRIPEAWRALFNAILLGLLAGIFEETARLILFKFSLKNVKTWAEGILVGAIGVKGVVAVCAVISLAILFSLRPMFVEGMPGEMPKENWLTAKGSL